MLKKRNVVNKPNKIKCMICDKLISPYGLPSHIKYNHTDVTIEEYITKYGEFRKNKLQVRQGKRNISKITCEICNNDFSIVGMFTHLRDTHNLTVEAYVNTYSEYRPKFIDYNKRAKENKIKCLICGKLFGSERLLSYHLKIDHNINNKKTEYIIPYVFKNQKQNCECGCGTEIKILDQPPYRVDFVSGHNPNGMTGKRHKKSALKTMSEKAISRMGKTNKSNTDIELKIKTMLDDNNIKYEQQYPTEYGAIDFYLPDFGYIEVDGSYWHFIKKEHMNIFQLANSISEFRKRSLNNLHRIKDIDVDKVKNLDDVCKYSYEIDYSITYRQKILTKEYFRRYIELKGKDKLKKYIPTLLKFTRTFHPEFPYLPQDEILQEVIDKISNYDLTKLKKDNRTFRNNSTVLGVNYLKSNFKSYWNSSFKGQKTPVEAWEDDELMKKVIEYRIGVNDSNEVFDFSMYQLIRGLSARRYTISFFKPTLAASIYYEYLGDNETPVVIDPCAGFGGRMLGFKSKYPSGTYIGIEPNPETFTELQKLVNDSGFSNVKLYNCKFEDFKDIPNAYDLVFTSIPYYDTEIYSNHVTYSSFNEWKNTFIKRFYEFDNVKLNMNYDVCNQLNLTDKIEFDIVSNTTHFDYGTNVKNEVIVSM